MEDKNRKQVATKDVARAVLLAIFAASITGCGVHGDLSLTPVDSYQQSQQYKRMPWKCMFTGCTEPTKEEAGS